MAIWVLKDGQREGPYEEQDVRELIYEGTYNDADSAIRDGQFDWSPLGDLLGRNPVPEPPEAPPSLPGEPGPGEFVLEPVAAPAEPAPEAAKPPEPIPPPLPRPAEVVIVDFKMPFISLVVLMLKWPIATVLAGLILAVIAAIFWGLCFLVLAGLLHH
jgi:hypothetical protein